MGGMRVGIMVSKKRGLEREGRREFNGFLLQRSGVEPRKGLGVA